jgi:hypothetical protein
MEVKKVIQAEHHEILKGSNRLSIIQTIGEHIENKMIITIERERIDKEEKLNGFPILLSNELLVMSKIVDFHEEGFIVLRLEDITDAYSKDSDAFYEEICIKEGLRDKIAENQITDILDFYSVFERLSDYNEYIVIQCEFEDNEQYFSIGKILSIEKDVIHFSNFDKMGMWEESERVIPIDKVTLVSIKDYYTNMFYKYL